MNTPYKHPHLVKPAASGGVGHWAPANAPANAYAPKLFIPPTPHLKPYTPTIGTP